MRHLILSFERAEVVGTTIAFHFKLKNDQTSHSRILGFHFELWQCSDASANSERRLCDLRLDAQPTISEDYTKLRPALNPNEDTPLRLSWTPTTDELQSVEDHRKGLSPAFRVKPLLLVDAVWPTTGPREQWRTAFGWDGPNCGNGWPLMLKMTDYEWIAILDRLNFKHNDLDRLIWPTLPPAFARSEAHLAAAWKSHRTGKFDAALNSCYKAFDCLGFNLTGQTIKRGEVLEFLMDGAEPEKQAAAMEVLKSMTGFCHLGRHENGPPINVTYEDSQFAVSGVTAALSYLATYHKSKRP